MPADPSRIMTLCFIRVAASPTNQIRHERPGGLVQKQRPTTFSSSPDSDSNIKYFEIQFDHGKHSLKKRATSMEVIRLSDSWGTGDRQNSEEGALPHGCLVTKESSIIRRSILDSFKTGNEQADQSQRPHCKHRKNNPVYPVNTIWYVFNTIIRTSLFLFFQRIVVYDIWGEESEMKRFQP
jgi:hypothetical protein